MSLENTVHNHYNCQCHCQIGSKEICSLLAFLTLITNYTEQHRVQPIATPSLGLLVLLLHEADDRQARGVDSKRGQTTLIVMLVMFIGRQPWVCVFFTVNAAK